MSKIEVSEVTSRRERNAFIKFQWEIYPNDPAWVPPLIIANNGNDIHDGFNALSCDRRASRAFTAPLQN